MHATQSNGRPAALITHPVFRQPAFGRAHPLSIVRHATTLDLVGALGWLAGADVQTCPMPARATLERFHHPAYLDAFEQAARSGKAETGVRQRYNLGTMECPLFEGLWERANATVGGAMLAAEQTVAGGTVAGGTVAGGVAFHPGGGTHHGRPDRASGFCYLNDPVFAVLGLRDTGCARILYVDFDAHHGDGVEAAFSHSAEVVTLSLHEAERWPYTGPTGFDPAGGALNASIPRGVNDSEYAAIVDRVVVPFMDLWRPDAVVVVCGADPLAGDPLSTMRLSNGVLVEAVMSVVELAPRAVVLGGGGYNPWTVARLWAALWGRLSRRETPAALPEAARAVLADLECDLVDEEDVEDAWLKRLLDAPGEGPVRPEVDDMIRELESAIGA